MVSMINFERVIMFWVWIFMKFIKLDLIKVDVKVGKLRKLQLDLHIEVKGLSFNICCFISCKVIANNFHISKSQLIYQTTYVYWHNFHIFTYPSQESVCLVLGIFQVKFISLLKLPWKIIVLFFCTHMFLLYF